MRTKMNNFKIEYYGYTITKLEDNRFLAVNGDIEFIIDDLIEALKAIEYDILDQHYADLT